MLIPSIINQQQLQYTGDVRWLSFMRLMCGFLASLLLANSERGTKLAPTNDVGFSNQNQAACGQVNASNVAYTCESAHAALKR